MRSSAKVILFSIILLSTGFYQKALACDCGPNPSVESEFAYSDLVIRGHIVATDSFTHTSASYLDRGGLRSGRNRFKTVVYHETFLRVTVVVDTNFKSSTVLPDTIYVLTPLSATECGINFPSYSYAGIPGLPKTFYDFVIYGSRYHYGAIVEKKLKKKTIREVVSNYSANTFETSRCRRTRQANPGELAALRRLKN